MKKILLILFILITKVIVIYGQFNSLFGSTSIDEESLKSCSFDPEAPAVVLIDEGYSDYTDNNGLVTSYHTRIKILKEEGRKYGDVSITYRSEDNFESVNQLEAIVINIDENGRRKEIPIERKSFFFKKLNKYRSEVSFAFPDVKVGSILEYKYTIAAKHYGGLKDWIFQSEIPVYRSSYKLKILPGYEISYLVQYSPKYKVTAKPSDDHSIFFEMINIPGMTDEPYMDARKDYIQKVIFQTTKYATYFGSAKYMSTWNEVTKELFSRQDFGRQLKLDISECQDFISGSLSGKKDLEKMHLIHDYVIRNVTWDGRYGIVAEDGIKSLWKKKSGNSGEINLLLINLLKSAGLEVYPMLVSERGHGKINKLSPFISQFNNVYAAVFINGKKYYLDATDKYTPSHLIPYSILNTTAFIADNKKGGLLDIEEPEIRYHDIVSIKADLDENGELAGTVGMLSKDYARTERLRNYSDHKSDYVDDYIKRGLGNVSISDFKIKDAENDSLPFKQDFNFKTYIQTTGDYSFLSMNMFSGFESNPFIINERFSNINFGFRKSLNLNFIITLPQNYKVDALPKNIKLMNADQSVIFTREIFPVKDKSQLVAKIRVYINKSLFGVDEYAEVKEFFKHMISLMNEQVVLKKI